MALQWTQFVSFSSLLPSHTLVQGYVSWTEDEPVRFLKLKTGALTASDHDLTQTALVRVEKDTEEVVDVMAPKKDTRPAGVEAWKFKVCSILRCKHSAMLT